VIVLNTVEAQYIDEEIKRYKNDIRQKIIDHILNTDVVVKTDKILVIEKP
jgi:hypothetical protein